MRILSPEKPSLEELLEHSGVKGMKWGVRKAFPSGGRPVGGITDRIAFGKRGVAKLQKRVDRGMAPRNARLLSSGTVAARAVLAVYGVLVAKNVASKGITNAVLAKNTARFAERGQQEVLSIMATAATTKFAKKRGGAFVITTMT